MARRVRPLAQPPGGFRRIAILRLSSLGDIVLTQPVVQALALAFPQARISFWIKEEFADLVRFDPAIAHVRVLERDARRLEDLISMSAELEDADLIVDLHGNMRTRILTFRQKAPVLTSPSYRVARSMQVHARWARRPPPPPVLARYGQALAPLNLRPAGSPRVTAGAAAESWAADWLASWGAGAAPMAMIPGA